MKNLLRYRNRHYGPNVLNAVGYNLLSMTGLTFIHVLAIGDNTYSFGIGFAAVRYIELGSAYELQRQERKGKNR